MSQFQKYREVYELYQLCSNGKDLKEFCINAGVNYKKFTEWQRKQLWLGDVGLYLKKYLYPMIDERIIELYRSLLAAANEEKGMLYAQIKALTEEVSMLRQSMDQSKQSIDNLLSEIKSLGKKLEEKDNRIADLEQQLYDAHEQAKLDKKKRFVRSSEQDKERI